MFTKKSNYSMFLTLPILLYLCYILYMHIQNPLYMSLLDNADFFVHEFWHMFFMFFWNEFLSIVWGTLMQLIIPLSCLIWFFIQKDYFAISCCYAWIWTNFFYISMYSSDAILQQLPLFWNGGDLIHDWNYIFSNLGILKYTNLMWNIFFYIWLGLFLLGIVTASSLIINRIMNKEI